MHHTLRQQLLEQIIAIIEHVRPLLEAIRRKDRDLASQLQRALNSIGLNVAEGFGSQAGNARLRFQCAHGSLYEAQAALRLAAAWGHVDGQNCAAAVQALDTLGARLFGLSRR
jgi:four helix bundle protein